MAFRTVVPPAGSFTSPWFNADMNTGQVVAIAASANCTLTMLSGPHQDGDELTTQTRIGISQSQFSTVATLPIMPYYQLAFANASAENNTISVHCFFGENSAKRAWAPTVTANTNLPFTGFGELMVESLDPTFHESFAYSSFRTRMDRHGTNGASASFSDQLAVVVGSTATSCAQILSRAPVTYRAGRGLRARFTAQSANPSAGFIAKSGLIGPTGCFAIGWSNTVFGLFYQKMMQVPIYALSVTVCTTGAVATLTLNGTSTVFTVPAAYNGTVGGAVYVSGLSVSQMDFGWSAQAIGATVVFHANACFVPSLTFTVSANAAQFAATFSAISTPMMPESSGFIPQSQFNIDKLDGTGPSGMSLSASALNVFEFVIQYLGAGDAFARVETRRAGMFETFHQVTNSNLYSVTNFYAPNFHVGYEIQNYVPAATRMSLTGACVASFIDGEATMNATQYGVRSKFTVGNSAGSTTISNTFSNVFTFRPRQFVGSKSLLAEARLQDLSLQVVGGTGNSADIAIFTSPTLTLQGGPPLFTLYDSESIMDINSVTTTVSGKPSVMYSAMVGSSGIVVSLDHLSLTVNSGDLLCVAARADSVGTTITTSINWIEQY